MCLNSEMTPQKTHRLPQDPYGSIRTSFTNAIAHDRTTARPHDRTTTRPTWRRSCVELDCRNGGAVQQRASELAEADKEAAVRWRAAAEEARRAVAAKEAAVRRRAAEKSQRGVRRQRERCARWQRPPCAQ